jgi:hypothetical protein
VYRTTNFVTQRAVLYDFTLSRAGDNPRRVLGEFNGTLVTDDFSGYVAARNMLSLSRNPRADRLLLGD